MGAGRRLGRVMVLLGLALVVLRGHARAYGLLDESPDMTTDNLITLFPNWRMAEVAAFDLDVCTVTTCPGCVGGDLVGLTIYNYGTAVGGTDIAAVYFNVLCGKTNTTATLTYANVWNVGGFSYAAWTWSGDIPWAADPTSSCAATPLLTVFADVASCPTDGASVTMGLGYNDTVNPVQPGGLWDKCGYQVPSYVEPRTGRTKLIRYVTKTTDNFYVAPGDTVTYTVFYGLPGGPGITNVVVTDSIPADTHYVAGSASTAPDVGWDPSAGPPMVLRWTLPGAASTSGGPTRQLTFQVTVDWGNTESFEPGSGDEAAMEGARLTNVAAVEFNGSGCPGAHLNPPVDAIVRRYLIWKTADQDVLFASSPGMPPDEIIYSIFVRNVSTTKTWWRVSIWDTVPAALTTWAPSGGGFYDPCAGAWTMTPTAGCSAGTPGWTGGAPTILTWTVDLPPGATIQVQWKGQVTAAALAGSTAISRVSVMELGAPATVGGTGNARAARTFIHLALIVLRTTYISYVGQYGSDGGAGLAINFYPLNKAAVFELYKLYYGGAGLATVGGVSASINGFEGTCAGGFLDGGYGGCGLERAPAQYLWPASTPSTPNLALYKLVANAPLLWILEPQLAGSKLEDAFTYLPGTTLNESAFVVYGYRRPLGTNTAAGCGDDNVVINTSLDENNVLTASQPTSVHCFKWDPVNLVWSYVVSGDLDGNSLWMPFDVCLPTDEGHYKFISSDNKIIVYEGLGTWGSSTCGDYNDHGGMAACAQNGLKVTPPGSAGTLYAICNDSTSAEQMLIGNMSGVTTATYQLWHYRPKNPTAADAGVPIDLSDSSGYWDLYETMSIPAGFTVGNPRQYGGCGAPDNTAAGIGGAANAWKIEWIGGGNLASYTGTQPLFNWSGGSRLDPANGQANGPEYWDALGYSQSPAHGAVLFFGPSSGMALNVTSNDGTSATYTTNAADECIAFMNLSAQGCGARRVYHYQLLAAGTQAPLIAMYHQPPYREKFFTAPFVSAGTHYNIIAPPMAFSGQSFWITVVVVLGNGTGATKTDYCGTSSFTSTDPGALLESTPMASYDYTWSSSVAPCNAGSDNGTKLFFNVSLVKLGLQTIVASDTLDGSIVGLTAIMVVGADVKFFKSPRLSTAASGDTVQFKICWSNYSSASAFTFVVTDAVPQGTTYLPEVQSALECGDTDGVPFGVAYSTVQSASAPAAFTTLAPGSAPPAATSWLRWTFGDAGVQTTGCACFRVVVN